MDKMPDIIKERRTALGLTLAQIADIVGVSEATVQRWESGNIKTVRYDNLVKLAEVLRIHPAEFYGWTATAQPSDLSSEEREVLERYRALSPTFQKVFLTSLLTAAQAVQDQDKSEAGK